MNHLEKVWDAMALLRRVEEEEREARAEYDGYSWDWDGYWYTKINVARADATKAIDNLVDERIAAKLKELGIVK